MNNYIDIFKQIYEYSQDTLDFNLKAHNTEFYIYSIILSIDKELATDDLKTTDIINIVYNTWLKIDRENDISIGYIIDYVVANYSDIIKYKYSSYDIIEKINDYYIEEGEYGT